MHVTASKLGVNLGTTRRAARNAEDGEKAAQVATPYMVRTHAPGNVRFQALGRSQVQSRKEF